MRWYVPAWLVGCAPIDVPSVRCEGEVSLSRASLRFVGEAGDHLGTELVAPGDVDGDGRGDLVLSAYGSPTEPTDRGVFVLRGGPRLGRASLADPAMVIRGPAGALTGAGLGVLGDLNADGRADLLVGAPGVGEDRGAVSLLMSPLRKNTHVADAHMVLRGESAGDGVARVTAADVDGDGSLDLIVGGQPLAPGQPGHAYIVRDPQPGDSLDTAEHRIVGEPGDLLGRVAIAGDLDGDGLPEVLVAAEMSDVAGSDSGAVYVLHGPAELGHTNVGALPDFVYGAPGTLAGHGVTPAGDLDGDGVDDFVVGAPYDGTEGQGRAYVVTADVRGGMPLEGMVYLEGEFTGDRAGYRVAGVGDINGDGFDDLLVGAKLHDAAGIDAGAAYLVHGPILESMSLSDADLKLVGEAARDNAGAVERAGDLTGDGRPDLVVGARLHGDDERALAGAVYVISCDEGL